MEPSLKQLMARGDRDAVAGFYDARAPSVREYCAELCAPELVDEAALATFVAFLGRVRDAPQDADADDLLRRSTRVAAASRAPASEGCDGVAELVAARANGELPHDERTLARHLERCDHCRRLVDRLAQAEDALVRTPTQPPSEEVRTAWLAIASREEPVSGAPSLAASPARRRQGGLVGAVRRFAGYTRRL